jgi:hypothetical protein
MRQEKYDILQGDFERKNETDGLKENTYISREAIQWEG